MTSSKRTSVSGVAFKDLTDPTIPVAFGGDSNRTGTLTKFQIG